MPCQCHFCNQATPAFYAAQHVPQGQPPMDPLKFYEYQMRLHRKWEKKKQREIDENKKKEKGKPKKFYEKTFTYLEMVGILTLFAVPVAALLKTLLRIAGL